MDRFSSMKIVDIKKTPEYCSIPKILKKSTMKKDHLLKIITKLKNYENKPRKLKFCNDSGLSIDLEVSGDFYFYLCNTKNFATYALINRSCIILGNKYALRRYCKSEIFVSKTRNIMLVDADDNTLMNHEINGKLKLYYHKNKQNLIDSIILDKSFLFNDGCHPSCEGVIYDQCSDFPNVHKLLIPGGPVEDEDRLYHIPAELFDCEYIYCHRKGKRIKRFFFLKESVILLNGICEMKNKTFLKMPYCSSVNIECINSKERKINKPCPSEEYLETHLLIKLYEEGAYLALRCNHRELGKFTLCDGKMVISN